MEFKEYGNIGGKKLVLLPGTGCSWQINFSGVVDELAKRYHLICLNYDGFEGDPSIAFTNMIDVTEKIERYLLDHHDGRVDGAYGSSLGGSFVGLLVQRKHIHIDHAFIGSSDLDQGSKFVAKLMTLLVGPFLNGAAKSEEKRGKLKKRFAKSAVTGDGESTNTFINAFLDNLATLHPKTLTNQFYSDYITPLEDDIQVDGTTIHVIYALKMGEKYRQRYLQHFHQPDILEFDMAHEVWLYDDTWKPIVMKCIDDCMEVEYESV